MLLWARATRAFADESPWIGAGVGSVDAWIATGDSFSSELHSEVFRVKIELGWLGHGLFMGALAALWLRLLREVRRATREGLTVALRAGCALLPVYALYAAHRQHDQLCRRLRCARLCARGDRVGRGGAAQHRRRASNCAR